MRWNVEAVSVLLQRVGSPLCKLGVQYPSTVKWKIRKLYRLAWSVRNELQPQSIYKVVVDADGKENVGCGLKTASQSSTGIWGGIMAVAQKAMDGDSNTDWFKGSCTHTAPGDKDPWLTIDLGCPKTVKSVKITNRKDCCTSRLSNFEIVLSNQPYATDRRGSDDLNVCAFRKDTFSGTLDIKCEGVGRFLTVRFRPPYQSMDQRYIHICEMKVNYS